MTIQSPSAPPRRVTAFTATCLLISSVIGSGIFTTTGFLARDIGHPMVILWLWVVGALFALVGAMCYSELGAALPFVGGEYVYLRHAYHPLVAFLSGWSSFAVGFGAAIAAGAVSFSSYFFQLIPVPFRSDVLEKGLAIGLVWALTGVHMAGVGLGSLFQQGITILKVALMGGFVVGAFTIGQGSFAHLDSEATAMPGVEAMFVSLIFVTYAYSGWNAAGYIAGEMLHPGRTIPVTMIGGTIFVGTLYVLINLVYFYALPVSDLARVPVLPVAQKAAVALFGPTAAEFITALLCISIAGAVSAMVWAGPRVYYAMAQDRVFPAFLAKLTQKGGVPARAILLQSLWVTLLIFSGTFEQLVIYSGVIVVSFSALAVGAVLILRRKRPELSRPYRVPLYPFLPISYLMLSTLIVLYTIQDRPVEAGWAMATVLAGVPLYLCRQTSWFKTAL
ncbi:MAG: amino acid permease [Nitrospirae bacterium]|nr:MAG: amino acid permease [Nitrospirota bacterium]